MLQTLLTAHASVKMGQVIARDQGTYSRVRAVFKGAVTASPMALHDTMCIKYALMPGCRWQTPQGPESKQSLASSPVMCYCVPTAQGKACITPPNTPPLSMPALCQMSYKYLMWSGDVRVVREQGQTEILEGESVNSHSYLSMQSIGIALHCIATSQCNPLGGSNSPHIPTDF